MSSYVNLNGNFLIEQDASISINNRSFRYGDGCFETIKVIDGKILLPDLHFIRLFSSFEILQFKVPLSLNAHSLTKLILDLVNQNGHSSLARVRVTIFRSDGGLFEDINHRPNFLIQSWQSNENLNCFNDEGLVLDIFYDAKKSSDHFSAIKSNNYLPYIMGALYAKKNKLDDCVILNCFNRIAEATIANVFTVANGVIKTPALSEGCVNGVMRKYLISAFKKENLPFVEDEINTADLLSASEVFLTNAMYGIRWVKQINNSYYTNQMSSFLHKKYIAPLFSSSTF